MVQHVSVSCPINWLIPATSEREAEAKVTAASLLEPMSSTANNTLYSPRASTGEKAISGTDFKPLSWPRLTPAGICLSTTTAHQDFVLFATWSSSGRFVASASYDNSVNVWEFAAPTASNGEEADSASAQAFTRRRHFIGHTNAVRAVVFTPDERHIVSGSWDGTIRVWSFETAECVRTLQTQSGLIYGVLLSPSNHSFIFSAVRYSTAPAFQFLAEHREIVCSDEPGSSLQKLSSRTFLIASCWFSRRRRVANYHVAGDSYRRS